MTLDEYADYDSYGLWSYINARFSINDPLTKTYQIDSKIVIIATQLNLLCITPYEHIFHKSYCLDTHLL